MVMDINYKMVLDFQRGSSLVNFCEGDIYTRLIVENFNTWSSLVISLMGLIGILKILYSDELLDVFKKHSDIGLKPELIRYSELYRYMLNFMLILIGLGSMYFHSHNSQFSHWVDIILISMILVMSDYYMDNMFKRKIIIIHLIIGCIHLITSLFIPSIHIFIQFATGFMIIKKINYNMKKLKDKGKDNYDILEISKKVEKKYFRIKLIFYLSLLLWIIDFFLCGYIYPFHTHWLFHIAIGYVGYGIIDLSKYLYLTESFDIVENRV